MVVRALPRAKLMLDFFVAGTCCSVKGAGGDMAVVRFVVDYVMFPQVSQCRPAGRAGHRCLGWNEETENESSNKLLRGRYSFAALASAIAGMVGNEETWLVRWARVRCLADVCSLSSLALVTP